MAKIALSTSYGLRNKKKDKKMWRWTGKGAEVFLVDLQDSAWTVLQMYFPGRTASEKSIDFFIFLQYICAFNENDQEMLGLPMLIVHEK